MIWYDSYLNILRITQTSQSFNHQKSAFIGFSSFLRVVVFYDFRIFSTRPTQDRPSGSILSLASPSLDKCRCQVCEMVESRRSNQIRSWIRSKQLGSWFNGWVVWVVDFTGDVGKPGSWFQFSHWEVELRLGGTHPSLVVWQLEAKNVKGGTAVKEQPGGSGDALLDTMIWYYFVRTALL